MCAPVIMAAPMFAASLAVSAVTGIVSYMGAQAQADAQYEAAVANNEALRNASISNMVQQSSDLAAREKEERAATGVRVQNQKLRAMRAKGTARATSESAGLSMEMLYRDFDRQYLNFADSQLQQLGFNLDQIQRQREGVEAQAEGRINTGWDNRPINQPSLGETLLGIAAEGLNAYATYSVRDPITGDRTMF